MKFTERIISYTGQPLMAGGIDILQVNLGYKCNQSCKHCHISSGPKREELMGISVLEALIEVISTNQIDTFDITGGAPELHPELFYLIKSVKKHVTKIILRTNLTAMLEGDIDKCLEFYGEFNITLVASLCHYLEDVVDRVRGAGVFRKSIEALKRLNQFGYGSGEFTLNLVYNPAGAILPPCQSGLEEQFKEELNSRHGVVFDNLYVLSNMPVGRFKDFLVKSGNYKKYMDKLTRAFNPETLDTLMCRNLINVSWDGRLFDCDFNQMLGLIIDERFGDNTIFNFDKNRLSQRLVTTGEHCIACTAGQGST